MVAGFRILEILGLRQQREYTMCIPPGEGARLTVVVYARCSTHGRTLGEVAQGGNTGGIFTTVPPFAVKFLLGAKTDPSACKTVNVAEAGKAAPVQSRYNNNCTV